MENKLIFQKFGVIVAVFAFVLSLIALNRSKPKTIQTAEQNDTLQKILTTHKMSVCYAVWPPAVIKDAKTGELSGHDIDAMKLLASEIGATPEFHETTFGNMAAAIQSGECDIGTSLFIKIPRAAAVAFSIPLFYAGNSALVRKGEKRFKVLEDIDKPGIKVVVATGESGHIYAKQHFKHAQIIPIDVESSDLSRFLLEVTSGRADIGLADANTIRLFAALHPESKDIFANHPFDINPDALPLRMGDQNFLNYINNSLLYMQTSGIWRDFQNKYHAHWLHSVQRYELQ